MAGKQQGPEHPGLGCLILIIISIILIAVGYHYDGFEGGAYAFMLAVLFDCGMMALMTKSLEQQSEEKKTSAPPPKIDWVHAMSQDLNSIEVSYTVFGYNAVGETSFEMEVNDRDYEWLQQADEEVGFPDSEYISEHRKGLHKRILRAIRENMNEHSYDPDDGMVETYISGVHRKEFKSDSSYGDMHSYADDDDIEYEVTV